MVRKINQLQNAVLQLKSSRSSREAREGSASLGRREGSLGSPQGVFVAAKLRQKQLEFLLVYFAAWPISARCATLGSAS